MDKKKPYLLGLFLICLLTYKSSLQISKQCITQLGQIFLENSEHHMLSTTTVSLLIPDYKKLLMVFLLIQII